MNQQQPLVMAVSDATGETAQQTCRAALAQFGKADDTLILVRSHILDEEGLEKVIVEAKSLGAMVAYTIVGAELRPRVKELAEKHDVRAVDLLTPLIARLARHMDESPRSVPGLGYELDEEYFRRVEAVEFAVYNDDGREPRNLTKADIVIVGISRTSKTPLSNYIAHRGYKVANVPLVLDLPTPPELDDVDPQRVFGLVIEPSVLMKIRRERMEALHMRPDSEYGDIQHIRREATWAKRILDQHPQWTVINVTRKAVEETAARILTLYRSRFEARPGEDMAEAETAGKNS
ncbi:MAG: pyruvate, water dikinase regulatory protein [Planctomycetota bacterium]|nr:pyruvate, water dikinase regulatory protein [Planctomycetota bacterium]